MFGRQKFFDEMSCRQNIMSTKCRVDEVSCRRNVLSTKCLSTKCLSTKCRVDEVLCRRKFFDKNLSTICLSTNFFRPTTYLPKELCSHIHFSTFYVRWDTKFLKPFKQHIYTQLGGRLMFRFYMSILFDDYSWQVPPSVLISSVEIIFAIVVDTS